jgi:23S rRNA (cytosine1962-C5)-methyltransferase
MTTIILKPDRERSLLRRHPWIFEGAIDTVRGNPPSGGTVDVVSAAGEFVARGAWSPQSQIRVRVWTFDAAEAVDAAFFERRIAQALHLRNSLGFAAPDGACRLINAESDGLPGLVVDNYAGFLVCQCTAAGIEHWRDMIVGVLAATIPCTGIYERSDVAVREKEGLAQRTGVMHGDEPPNLVAIRENEIRMLVDIKHGHKTGWYLDQRDSRTAVGLVCNHGEILNCFAYTGGFTVSALLGGAAHVVNIDSSAPVLELLKQNVALNQLADTTSENIEGNVSGILRRFRDSRRSFDAIILDPPKFVESAHQLQRGGAAYKDINLLALKLLKPGGTLVTFSCSGHMRDDLFQTIVAEAASDAGRDVRIIGRLAQAADHPVLLSFPEGAYLKGLVCKVE